MLWRFMENDEIALTNNEAERALRGYVLWRKGSYGVWSHRGEQFRQRILSLVEMHIPADHEHQFRFNVNTISGPM